MTLSIWRYAHLALAIISSVFLLLLSITGVILAVDAVQEKTLDYRVQDIDKITLAQSLPALREAYFEILQISVDHNHFVTLEAMDEDGNTFHSYINPLTAERLGDVKAKSSFIQWTTALHRSLFLKEVGRTLVGIVSFLLMLITISGFILIIKRQQGLKNFFNKVNKDFLSQYFHVVTGRWLLIPVLMIALTGTIIFIVRLDFFKSDNIEINYQPQDNQQAKEFKDIDFFKNTKLIDVEKVEFPFIPDDPEEPFIITFQDRVTSINQINGELMHESKFPYAAVLEKINIDLHTGRTNSIWAIILGLASLNIIFFLYTGFEITFKRTAVKIKNKFNAQNAEIIILVGTENGSTLFFANKIHRQLLSDGKRSYLSQMNQYTQYPKAKHILIFTSTYGLGDAPSNATKFQELVQHIPQEQTIDYAVIGFGSTAYKDYCAYAKDVDHLLSQQSWARKTLDIHLVNDRSAEDFVNWAHHWSEKSLHTLVTAPSVYKQDQKNLKKFTVVEKTAVNSDNSTFRILLKTKQKFQSGDLLAIYPANDNRERFYSIGKTRQYIQLIVKLFPDGLGSNYLYNLQKGQEIKARIMENSTFHFPKTSAKVAMIANGTGIAPFLGMVDSNDQQSEISLYVGFRNDNELSKGYKTWAEAQIQKNHLKNIHFAFSREKHKQYVMDLIKRDEDYFVDLLENGHSIMICGALKMQKDVEHVLETILEKKSQHTLNHYKLNNQILTDCY